jgi:hypothetical protein
VYNIGSGGFGQGSDGVPVSGGLGEYHAATMSQPTTLLGVSLRLIVVFWRRLAAMSLAIRTSLTVIVTT